MTGNTIRYGDWHIAFNPPPIPVRCCDFQFWHDDFDACDSRCGTAATLDDAKAEIDMLVELEAFDRAQHQ